MLPVLTTLLLTTGQTPGFVQNPLKADTAIVIPSGPKVVFARSPGQRTAVIRVSVPMPHGESEVALAKALQSLTVRRMESRARWTGAQIHTSHSSWGISYQVEGAAADFEHLGQVAKTALDRPEPDGLQLRRLGAELRETANRALETPGTLIRSRLLRQAGVTLPELAQPPDPLAMEPLLRLWKETHHPSRAVITVVSPLEPEVILSSLDLAHWAGPSAIPESREAQGQSPSPSNRRVQVLRHWYGEAHRVGSAEDPLPTLLTILLEAYLSRQARDYELFVELRDVGSEGGVLLITGAAYRQNARAMREAIRNSISDLRDVSGPAEFDLAREEVKTRVLTAARYPLGLANTIGHLVEETGDADGAAEFFASLDRITLEGFVNLIDDLLSRDGFSAEVTP